jgi:hypothetical protein
MKMYFNFHETLNIFSMFTMKKKPQTLEFYFFGKLPGLFPSIKPEKQCKEPMMKLEMRWGQKY